MRDHQISGAFLQRFLGGESLYHLLYIRELSDHRSLIEVKNGNNGMRRYRDEVVERVRDAANQNGRVVSAIVTP
jgi:hypothetical protein